MTAARGTALVRPPGPRLTEGIVTHRPRRPVGVGVARAQHRAYVAALDAAGWAPVVVEPADEHPDAVFVEDTLVVVDDVAVVTRPGAPARRGETAGSAAAARALGMRVVTLEPPGHLDGGDVLQVGRTVYVGQGGRTDDEGIRQLGSLLTPLGRTVVPVRLGPVLHLKSAATALPDGTVVGQRHLLDTDAFPTWHEVAEESGSHVVPLGGSTLLIAASAPRTADWLEDTGYDVVRVEIGEFEKLEGCVTCLSVLVSGR